MVASSRARALLVGSISLDVEATRSVPGGVVHHAGLALCRLGVSVRVVTRLREDDRHLLDPLFAAGAEVHWRASANTTTYRNDYGPDGDRHELLARSDSIEPSDVPAAFCDVDFVQLGPLHPDDVAPELADLDVPRETLRGIDVQGYARGVTTALAERQGRAVALARTAHVAQVSADEMEAIFCSSDPADVAARLGVAELVVTRGARGASVFTARGGTTTAAHPVTRVAAGGSTGAGDVFLACYLLQRRAGASVETASRRAAAVAAIKIENGELPAGLAVEELAP